MDESPFFSILRIGRTISVCSSMPRSASGEEKDEKSEKTKTAKIAERLAKVSLQ